MYMHTHTGKAFSPPGLYAPHSHPPHRPPTPHICAQLWTHTIPSTRNWARARMYWLTCNTCTVSRAICTVSRATHVLSHVQHTLHFLRTLPHLLVFAIPVPAHHIVRPPHATTHSRRHGAAHTRRLASCTDLQTIRVGVQTKWAHTCWHKHTHKSSISLAS